jgi:metal-responsive CopG/Arc/MetJ family transcriptional regulator
MVKMTFTFDEETVHQLELAAARTKKPKSQIVREAIRDYADRTDKLSNAERQRMLNILDKYIETAPRRSRADIEAEIEEIRAARRRGGRRHPVD